MGMPPAIIAQLNAADPSVFEVWPANMPVVDTWLSIATQWRTTPLADGRVHWLGLDYAAVRAGFDMAGLTVGTAIWSGVQVMERAAAAALNGVAG